MTVEERFRGANTVEAGRLSPYWGEHVARYRFALPFVENRTVLDIACGTGYGIGFIQGRAAAVTGVDVDADAVRQAKQECGKRSAVLLADGLTLPFGDGTFEVITSFETLEHIYHRDRFLAELRRVLRPDGVLLLSTPNANYTQPVDGKPSNPFHIHEYTPEELQKELTHHFFISQFLGQSLSRHIRISPFYEDQRRLPGDAATQLRLISWKVFNKIPLNVRERLSGTIWNRPFYPTEMDYNFTEDSLETAPVLFAVCRTT
jgi:SAM-dependent methyltransferase